MEQNSKKGKWLWVDDDKIHSTSTITNNHTPMIHSNNPNQSPMIHSNNPNQPQMSNSTLINPSYYSNSIYNCKMTLKPHMVFVSHDKYPNCIILQFKLEDQKIILTSQKSKHPPAHMSLQPLMESFPYSSPTQPNKLVISEITVQIDDQQIKHPITQEEIYHTGNPKLIKLTPQWSWLLWSSNCRSKVTGVKSWVVNGVLIYSQFTKPHYHRSQWSVADHLQDDEE